jgi:hypothetical protein
MREQATRRSLELLCDSVNLVGCDRLCASRNLNLQVPILCGPQPQRLRSQMANLEVGSPCSLRARPRTAFFWGVAASASPQAKPVVRGFGIHRGFFYCRRRSSRFNLQHEAVVALTPWRLLSTRNSRLSGEWQEGGSNIIYPASSQLGSTLTFLNRLSTLPEVWNNSCN